VKRVRLAIIFGFGFWLSGCAWDPVDSGFVTAVIKIPSLRPPEVSPILMSDQPPTDNDAFDCLGVNVSGAGIPVSAGSPVGALTDSTTAISTGNYCVEIGETSTLAANPVSGPISIDLRVPVGPSRLVQVFGLNTTGACPIGKKMSQEFKDSNSGGVGGVTTSAWELTRRVTGIYKDTALSMTSEYGPLYRKNLFTCDRYTKEILNTSGLKAYYKLGDFPGTTSNAADSKGGYGEGAYAGFANLTQVSGIPASDGAMTTNLVGAKVLISSPGIYDGTSGFTLEVWAKINTSAVCAGGGAAFSGIVHLNDVSNPQIGISCKLSGSNVFHAYFSTDTYTSITFPNDTDWYHLALVIAPGPGQVDFYVNGISEFNDPVPVGAGFTINSIGILSGPSSYFPGSVDEVAIYERALTAAEIQAHYNSGMTPP
jgi:hypothetical protein